VRSFLPYHDDSDDDDVISRAGFFLASIFLLLSLYAPICCIDWADADASGDCKGRDGERPCDAFARVCCRGEGEWRSEAIVEQAATEQATTEQEEGRRRHRRRRRHDYGYRYGSS
jgi:hypothetical protein